MNFKNLTVTKKVLGILTIMSIIFMAMSYTGKSFYIPYMEKDEYKIISQRMVQLLDKEINLKKEVGSSNVAAIASINRLSTAMASNDREGLGELFKSIGKQYKEHTSFQNTKLHLHTKDLKSYYRSWDSKRYGDDLGFRAIVKKVNNQKKSLTSISINGKGMAMVSVIPLYSKNKFIGTLEFMQGLNSVQKSLKKQDFDFLFLMDKTNLSIAKRIKSPKSVGDYILNIKTYDNTFLNQAKEFNFTKLLKDGYLITDTKFITYKNVKAIDGKKLGIYLMAEDINTARHEIDAMILLINLFFGASVLLIIAMLGATAFTFYIFATKPIIKAVQNISSGNDQIVSASQEISGSATMLAESSSSQAASVEEISATIEQTSATIEQTANNSREADILSSDASNSAQEGYEKVKTLLVSMNEITSSSKEIANIIKTIDEIAFQTNLLALNAAVEAARAGEHGLGFAVVADEVRNLAGKSANAAKETATIIEHSLSQVNNGNKIANDTHKAFEEIMDKIKKSSNLVSEISLASKEQTEGMKQINHAMNQIDNVTQTVASTSEESAAASEELNAQAVSMGDTISSIGAMVGYKVETDNNISKPIVKKQKKVVQPIVSKKTTSTKPTSSKKAEDILPLDDDDMFNF